MAITLTIHETATGETLYGVSNNRTARFKDIAGVVEYLQRRYEDHIMCCSAVNTAAAREYADLIEELLNN